MTSSGTPHPSTPDRDRPPPLPIDQRYRSLFEDHPHAVFGLDRQGRFVEANPAAGRLSGRSPAALVGVSCLDLVEPDDRERITAAFDRVMDRATQQLDLQIRRGGDDVVELEVTGIPWIVDEQVRGVHGIATDVTERNRVARDLEVTRQLAVAASRAKSDFVARMSHELRTPLTSILASSQLLAGTEPGPEQDHLVRTLQRSGLRLMGLVDSVLDFGTAGTVDDGSKEEFDLHAVIRDVVVRVEEAASHKGLLVRVDLDDAVPRRLRDHPTWTTQILTHLLDNAVRHTETGHVGLAVSMTTSAAAGPCVMFRVSDTGSGIDPAHHDLVFEPFTHAPGSPDPGPRAGLGLSIVRQLVTISGGSLALDSAPGRGSIFSVVIPAEPVTDPR